MLCLEAPVTVGFTILAMFFGVLLGFFSVLGLPVVLVGGMLDIHLSRGSAVYTILW